MQFRQHMIYIDSLYESGPLRILAMCTPGTQEEMLEIPAFSRELSTMQFE